MYLQPDHSYLQPDHSYLQPDHSYLQAVYIAVIFKLRDLAGGFRKKNDVLTFFRIDFSFSIFKQGKKKTSMFFKSKGSVII